MSKSELIRVAVDVTPEQLPAAIQELGRLVGENVIVAVVQVNNFIEAEQVSENLSEIYDQELVEWYVDTNGEPVAVVTKDNLANFLARLRPNGNMGTEIARRIIRAGRQQGLIQEFLYYPSPVEDALGVRADRFSEFLELLTLHKLDVSGVGPKRLYQLGRYKRALNKET